MSYEEFNPYLTSQIIEEEYNKFLDPGWWLQEAAKLLLAVVIAFVLVIPVFAFLIVWILWTGLSQPIRALWWKRPWEGCQKEDFLAGVVCWVLTLFSAFLIYDVNSGNNWIVTTIRQQVERTQRSPFYGKTPF